MRKRTVVGLGESLWDCFGETRRPGGAPANVAFHANQLGMRGEIITRVGCDPPGDELVRLLARHGLSTKAIQRDSDHPTCLVTIDGCGADEPVYNIPENVAWDYIKADDTLAAATHGASAVCFGTLAQRCPVSRATIQRVLDTADGAMLVFDVNLRPPWYSREVIETSLRRCDVVKLNNLEVPIVSELLELGSTGVAGFASALREQFDVKVVCVTRGKRGCFALSREEHVNVAGRPAAIVDSVGAGDAFTAAFVCGLLWRWSLDRVARFACEVGALVAARQGAMPDLRDALERLRGRYTTT